MPWCPKCNAEYMSGNTVCSDCECALLEHRSIEPGENPNAPTLLTTARNEYEAHAIKAFLESEKIPVLLEFGGMGAAMTVIMGTSLEEVDVLVPKSCLHRAQTLLAASAEAVGPELPEEAEEEAEEEMDLEAPWDEPDALRMSETEDLGTGSGITLQILLLLVLGGFLIYLLLR